MNTHLFITSSRYAVIWLLVLCTFSVHAGTISTIATINHPINVAVDGSGNLYATSSNYSVFKVTPGGVISTIAGTGIQGFDGDGVASATSVRLYDPQGIAVNSSGIVYITDSDYLHRIRQITPAGFLSRLSGGGYGFSGDGGAATSATFSNPLGLAINSSGDLYIADKTNHRIRKITAGGIVSTVAGNGIDGYAGDGGAATSAKLGSPYSVAVDSSGNLYIGESIYSNRVRKVTSGGTISTVAGGGTLYNVNGVTATSAQLGSIQGVAVDSTGNLYIAEYPSRVRKVTPGGIISTVAGYGYTSQLDQHFSLAVDSSDNLYVADSDHNRLGKVIPAPIMEVRGNGTSILSGSAAPVTTDNTDFGSTPVGTPVSKTFTINSIGELSLNLTGSPKVSVTGSGFSVTTQPTSPVAALTGTTNFVIQFAPTASGTSNGTVSIVSNDGINSTYTFSITGTGNALNQTISFSAPASGTYNGSGSLSATATSGLTVTFTSAITSVCTVSGTTVSYVGAGTCTINANQAGNTTYNAAPQVSGNITISQASQTITGFSPTTTGTYGGTASLSATGGSSGNAVTFSSTTTGICTVSGSTVSYVAPGTCTVKADQAGNTNYSAAPQVSANITVGQASQTITGFSPTTTGTYGGTASLSATGGSSGNAVTFSSTTTGICTVSGSTVTYVAPGTCTVKADQAGNTNYSAATQVSANITVGQASQTITFNPIPQMTYGDAAFTVTPSASSGLTVTLTATGNCSVAGTTVTINGAGSCNVVADQAGNSNYSAAPAVSQSFLINKANQTLTFNAIAAKTYGDAPFIPPTSTTSGLAATFVVATNCTLSGSTVTLTGAGTCGITAAQAGDSNYNAASSLYQTVTINKANQTITGFSPPATGTYGGTASLTATNGSSTSPLVFSSATTGVCTVSGSTVTYVAPGTCTINVNQAADANYNAAPQVSGNITVNKAVLTATANDKTRVYGAANPAFDLTYSGFVNSEAIGVISSVPTANSTAINTTPAGTATITCTGGTDDNYTINCVNGTLTITQATLTAQTNAKTRTYGAANPTFDFTYTGFLNGDTDTVLNTKPIAATAATVTSDVNMYPITCTNGSDNNYTMTCPNSTLTITQATLTAQTNAKTRVYGAANPVFDFTYTGFLNSDDSTVLDTPPVASTTAIATTATGTYPITCVNGTDNNYTMTCPAGTLTITKAPLTAQLNNKTRLYGAAEPTFDFTYTGFLNGDNDTMLDTKPVGTTTATITSDVNTYPINCTNGSDNNYDITCNPATLTLTQAALTAQVNAKARLYGATNPVFDFTYTGFLNNDTDAVLDTKPVADTTATVTSAMGTYPITCTNGTDNNYILTCLDETLTIGKAPLTAQLNDKTRYFGATNPVFDFTYTGFLNGDTDTVLDTKPVGSTSATTTDPAGLYGINCTNGSDNNYDITCQNAALYVVKGTVESIPMFNQTILFDTPVGVKQTQTLTLKNRGTSALIFNSINTPVAPFSYPKPMPFTFIPTGDPSGSPQSFDISCTPTEMGVKNMTLQITTNDPDNAVIAYPLECMGRQVVAVSSVANNSAVNFGNALINSTLSQSITITENGNSDLVLLAASITGTNAADFQITAPTEFPATVADGTTSSQTVTVTCTPKTATPLTATLQITTNDPVNATLNYPLQCGGLFNLTLSTSGQGTISGCGTSCVQNHQQDAVVNLSAVPATGWELSSWSGDCVNGQVTMTSDKSCGATFTQIVENPTTPADTTGTTTPTNTTTTPTNTTNPTGTGTTTGSTGTTGTTTGSTDTTTGNTTTSTGTTATTTSSTPTSSGGGSGNAVSVTATVPTSNGVVDGAMSNYNQVATNLTIPENASVSGGTLAGTVTNGGLAANVTVAPNSTVTGGKLSGFNTNLGTLNNVTVSQYSEVRYGNYAGTTQNNGNLINPIVSPKGTIVNNGTIENPILLPGANVSGGKMTGVIIALGGTYNSQVQPGTRVITRVQDIPPQMFNNFNAQTLNTLPPTIISQITPEQFAQIPLESISGLSSENMGAISPEVIQTLDKEQIQELDAEEFQAMPTEEVAKLLTNFDVEQITPQEAEKLLPARWTIDSQGNLTAPPGTRISVRSLNVANLPEGLRIPAIADLNSNFALGGKGSKTLISQMNQASAKDSFLLSQQKSGVVYADVAGAVGNGQKSQFAFMIDPEQIFLLDENALRGLQMNEQGQYIIVTEDGKQIPITPMTKDPEALLNVLGDQGGVDIQKSGEVLLKFNEIKRSRAGEEVHRVGMFDPFVEPAPEDICTPEGICDWSKADASMQPGVRSGRNTRAKSMVKVVYPDGTAQQVYPTVLSPEILVAEAKKIEGVEKITFRMDGTFAVTYQGTKLLLIPDAETQVQPIPAGKTVEPSLILESNTRLLYQVPYLDQLFSTGLEVTLAP